MNDNIKVYRCKDGRLRVYDKNTKRVTSYSRMIMEEHIGRELSATEQIHHIDGDANNNDISNLQILTLGEHQKLHSQKYFDKEMICPWCGKTFIWTAKEQQYFTGNNNYRKDQIHTGQPFCSKHCSGCYTRNEQLKGTYNHAAVMERNT